MSPDYEHFEDGDPARGCGLAIVLSLAMWGGIALIAWLFLPGPW